MLKRKQYAAIEILVQESISQTELANRLGVHRHTIANWFRTEEFLAELNKAVKKNLDRSCAEALNTMLSLLHSDSDSVRYNAAKDILDRTGFKATDKVDMNLSGGITIVDDIGDGDEPDQDIDEN